MESESQLFLAVIALVISYLLGSIPSGYLAGKWIAGKDLREFGSGSTGATNVLRQVGKKAALIVFLADVGKGTAAVLLARDLVLGEAWEVSTGLAVLAGHIWPIWLRWKGGKAVATGLGVMLGLSWAVGLACLGVFLASLSLSKIVSLSSIVAALSLPLLMWLSFKSNDISTAYLATSFAAMGLVLWRHRSNMKRLIAGTEPKIGHQN